MSNSLGGRIEYAIGPGQRFDRELLAPLLSGDTDNDLPRDVNKCHQ